MNRNSKAIQKDILPIRVRQSAKMGEHLYVKPCLVKYGDVRDITLGASGGTGESGAPLSRCNKGLPTFPPCI